jgi:hypothetical protein
MMKNDEGISSNICLTKSFAVLEYPVTPYRIFFAAMRNAFSMISKSSSV